MFLQQRTPGLSIRAGCFLQAQLAERRTALIPIRFNPLLETEVTRRRLALLTAKRIITHAIHKNLFLYK